MSTIIVVDDEPITLNACAQMLRVGDYRVLTATTPAEALDILQTEQPDLALLDVMMPQMNGIELAARILKKSPQTRILLMTGYGPREISKVAGEKNPYRIVMKPFRRESLLQMIENMLA